MERPEPSATTNQTAPSGLLTKAGKRLSSCNRIDVSAINPVIIAANASLEHLMGIHPPLKIVPDSS